MRRLLPVMLFLLAACADAVEDRARAHAARKLGVSELTQGAHRFLRATTRETTPRGLTVVVLEGIVLDAGTPGAFELVARAHDIGHQWSRFSASRLAGWFGALGGGGVCGEPLGDDAQVTKLEHGLRLTYRFARNSGPKLGSKLGTNSGTIKRCDVDLGEDGTIRHAETQAVPLARR